MLRDQLHVLLEPVVRGLGYELWELEYGSRQGGGFLRLYIDRSGPGSAPPEEGAAASESGITVDDCARVSLAVSEVMDAEDPVAGHYTLEVSSPGLDRVLRTPEHFARYAGAQVRLETKVPVNGRKRFAGKLAGVSGTGIRLVTAEGEVDLAIEGIHKARLVPEL